MPNIEILKIKNDSNPGSVAGAIAELMKTNRKVEIQAVGAGAVNQAVKSIIIARGYVAPNGLNLICIPAFANIELDGETRTAIKFIIKEEK